MSDLDFDLSEIDVFHFDDEDLSFNELSHENGYTYWYASQFMLMLGYGTFSAFKKAINKAIGVCTTLEIAVQDNFQQVESIVDGKKEMDYKLSRFACYLVAMNADTNKTQVAVAQAYFAASAEAISRYVDNADDVERVLIRDEISGHEKTLSSAATSAGVKGKGYALFQNAGYRGMYNMNLSTLKKYKGHAAGSRSLLDFMGKDELAANLFRLTQTELKLKNDNIKGQRNAERAAENVGRRVRQAMLDISGETPEDMALVEDIKKVRTSLKQTQKGLEKMDK